MQTPEPDPIDPAPDRRAVDKANRPVFTQEQASIALQRHGLGAVQEWVEIEGGFVNAVFQAQTTIGRFVVKIKFRPGFSLAVQRQVNRLVRDQTRLPVCRVCILDQDTEPFGHPFLICDRLPGHQGQTLFEKSAEPVQKRILAAYGRVLASLHGLDAAGLALPACDYRDWRGQIRRNLLADDALIAALPPASRTRVWAIADLLDRVKIDLQPVPQGLVWGDAMLRNLLLDDDGHLTGVIDFESAAWGDLLADQYDVESEFEGQRPRSIYGRTDFRAAFWESYRKAGGVRITPDRDYARIRAILQASGFCWLWQAAGVLSPQVPALIENLEHRLRELQATSCRRLDP